MQSVWRIVAVSLVTIAASCTNKSDDFGADKALIATTSEKALATLQASAAALGRTQLLEPLEGSIAPYLSALQDVAQSFPDAAGDDRKAINSVTYVGMSLATLDSAQAAGGVALAEPYTSESRVLEELMKKADEEGVEDFDSEELTDEAVRLLRMLGQMSILSDKALTDQTVPQDSPLRANWDKDKDGRIEIPLPPVGLPGVTSAWQDFTNDLTFERTRGSSIGRILLEVSRTAERLQLSLS